MPVKYTHKKSVAFFVSIGHSEVFDYLNIPISTDKAHAKWRERRRSVWNVT